MQTPRPHPITFRTATPDDVPALVTLVTGAYRGDSGRRGWTTESDLLDGNRIDAQILLADIIRAHSRVVMVPGQNDAPAACAHVAESEGAGYFGMFAVQPDLQGAGIGDALLRECERIAREEWHLPTMRMTVIDLRTELVAWYTRRGYQRTGRLLPFPYGDARFGIPRRDDLRFEVLEKPLR